MTEKRTDNKKPFVKKNFGDKKPFGEKKNFGDKKPFGEKKSFGDKKPFGEKKSFGDKKPFGEKKSFGDKKPFGKPASKKPEGERVFGRLVKDGPVESTGLSMNARRIALDVLCDVHQNGAFASLSLDEHLRSTRLSPADRRLVTSIVYGTLENELKIDYALDKLMDHPTHQPSQRDILRMSAYQILFLDRVPDSAAVNEAVKLVKAMNMEAASGFINAVLRNLSRGKEEIEWPKKEDDLRTYLSIMGSFPMWLVDRLIADYGEEEAERVILFKEKEHPIVIRPNFNKITDEQFETLLSKKDWRVERGLAPHAWLVYGAQEITFDNDFKAGLFSIQGQSSMLAAEAVQVKNGMKVLDACAAPGGKSAYLCEKMGLTGRVYSWELHDKRALLLEGVKRRLGLDNMRITVRDASEYREDFDTTLDAVLLDAPCAGLGVLSQKPDVKLRLKPEDIPAIVETQKKILNTVCRYVKKGGTLVYSTCSILPEENALQIQNFLAEHPEYELQPLPNTFPEELRKLQTPDGLQLLGCRDGVEGFFIARMKRVK